MEGLGKTLLAVDSADCLALQIKIYSWLNTVWLLRPVTEKLRIKSGENLASRGVQGFFYILPFVGNMDFFPQGNGKHWATHSPISFCNILVSNPWIGWQEGSRLLFTTWEEISSWGSFRVYILLVLMYILVFSSSLLSLFLGIAFSVFLVSI